MVLRKGAFVVGGIMLAALVGFFLVYVAFPVLAPYGSVRIPPECLAITNRDADVPASLSYAIPGVGDGALVAGDTTDVVVRERDYARTPVVTEVFLIRRRDKAIVWKMTFPSDIVDAAMHDRVAYIFNDKLGYFIEESTGRSAGYLIETDNYRGVYKSGNAFYVQTTAEFSAIGLHGNSLSHLRLNMRSIAFGCYFP